MGAYSYMVIAPPYAISGGAQGLTERSFSGGVPECRFVPKQGDSAHIRSANPASMRSKKAAYTFCKILEILDRESTRPNPYRSVCGPHAGATGQEGAVPMAFFCFDFTSDFSAAERFSDVNK